MQVGNILIYCFHGLILWRNYAGKTPNFLNAASHPRCYYVIYLFETRCRNLRDLKKENVINCWFIRILQSKLGVDIATAVHFETIKGGTELSINYKKAIISKSAELDAFRLTWIPNFNPFNRLSCNAFLNCGGSSSARLKMIYGSFDVLNRNYYI